MASRDCRWYPVKLPVTFRAFSNQALVQTGVGQTLRISSGGVHVDLGELIRPSVTEVEVSISWPMLLDRTTQIRLVMIGKILSSKVEYAEISADRYEFRTAKRFVSSAAALGRMFPLTVYVALAAGQFAECLEVGGL